MARPRRVVAALVALVITLLTLGCGDTVVFLSFNAGTIAGNPSCQNGTGQFDLLNQQGLVLLVLINSGTQISTSSGPAACTDLAADAKVQVRGKQSGTTISASSVSVE